MSTTAKTVPAVYKAIADVSVEIAKSGISKDRTNTQQGYKFRGIDDIYNALAPLLAKHGLVILPRILSRVVIERATKSGGVLFYVTVEAEFDFVGVADGSVHTARTYGEAMDSGDKATNKAMSAAYKYVTFQAFCIPTEGDNDADATTHAIVPKPPADAYPSARLVTTAPTRVLLPAGTVQILTVTPREAKGVEWADITYVDEHGVEAMLPLPADPRGAPTKLFEQLAQEACPVVLTTKSAPRSKKTVLDTVRRWAAITGEGEKPEDRTLAEHNAIDAEIAAKDAKDEQLGF